MTAPDAPPPEAQAPDWPEGRFAGRQTFQDLLVQGLQCAAERGCRTVWLCDPDFGDWPLGERRLVAALDRWCATTRVSPVAQIRVMGQSFADMRLRHARFVQWRGLWAHRVQVRAWSAGQDRLPSVLWTPEWVLRRVDTDRDQVVATTDPGQRTAVGERLQQLWQMARPALPLTVLGV